MILVNKQSLYPYGMNSDLPGYPEQCIDKVYKSYTHPLFFAKTTRCSASIFNTLESNEY